MFYIFVCWCAVLMVFVTTIKKLEEKKELHYLVLPTPHT